MKRSISTGMGSIVRYEKIIYVSGRRENAGRKVKKMVDRYRVRYRFKNEFGEQKQTSKSDFISFTDAKRFLEAQRQYISKGAI
jgi:hypothetical protein